jgi:hypothetical protein
MLATTVNDFLARTRWSDVAPYRAAMQDRNMRPFAPTPCTIKEKALTHKHKSEITCF